MSLFFAFRTGPAFLYIVFVFLRAFCLVSVRFFCWFWSSASTVILLSFCSKEGASPSLWYIVLCFASPRFAFGLLFRGLALLCFTFLRLRLVSNVYSFAYLYLHYSSTGHPIRNRKGGPGWISYLRIGAFYTNFSIKTLEFLIFQQNLSLPSLLE